MASTRPRLYIVDAMNLLYRAFHGVPPRVSRSGEPTNALYGFTAMMLSLLARHPEHLVVALDRPEITWRREQMARYKAHRKPTPPELKSQMKALDDLLEAFRMPVVHQSGQEADDVMATLSHQASLHGFEVIIISADRDLLQLVEESIHQVVPVHGLEETILFNPEGVRTRYSIEPNQIADYKALMGDPSDNLPGLEGIGEKRAVHLLQRFNSVIELLAWFEIFPSEEQMLSELKRLCQTTWTQKDLKLTRSLRIAYAKQAELKESLRFTTLSRTLDLAFEPQAFEWHELDINRALAIFERFSFGNLKNRLWDLTYQANQKAPEVSLPKVPSTSPADPVSRQLGLFDS